MADYDLGTAHGRIVIDYKDKGTQEAGKDLQALADKAKGLLAQFAAVRRKWAAESQGLVNDVTRVARSFTILAGTVAAASGLLLKSGSTISGLRGGLGAINAFSLAIGMVPRGAEGYPTLIKRIIQLSAAVSLFAGGASILARATRNVAVLGTMGALVGRFGSFVNGLAGPLHLVSGIALNFITILGSFRLITTLIKPIVGLNAAIAGLGAGMYAVSFLATGLWQAITQLVGVVGLIPAAIGVAALAIGTLKIGMIGLSDAFKVMDDAKKFDEALKKLAPSAQEFARAVRDISQKGFKELRLDVQQKLFAGLGPLLQTLAGKYLPLLRTNLTGVATTFNQVITQVGRMLATPDVFGHMTAAGTKFRQILANLGAAVAPLIEALIVIMDVGATVFVELTSGAGKAAQGFRDFIQNAAETGKLREWIMNALQGFKDLWATVKNVGSAIKTIFVGLNGGEGSNFLATIREMTARFNEFLNSAQGQQILQLIGDHLRHFADNARTLGEAIMTHVVPAIQAFTPLMQTLSDAFNAGLTTAIGILGPLFVGLGTAMSFLAPVTGPIVQALVTMTVVGLGLALAAKLIGAQLLILRTALVGLKAGWAVAAFGARLFTGNLRAGEAAVLRFIGLLIKNMVVGVARWIWGMITMTASTIAWVATQIWAGITAAASWVAARTAIVAQWIALKVAAAAHAIATGAVWLAQAIATRVALIASWIATKVAIVAQWIALRAVALANAIAVGVVWLAQTIASTAGIVAAWVAAKAVIIAQWIALKAASLANAIAAFTVWVVQSTIAAAGMVAAWIGARIAVVAGWIMMAAASIVNAAIMAASWFIALGPVGWVIGIIVLVVAAFIAFWPQITAAFQAGAAWLAGIWAQITAAFSSGVAAVRAALGPFAGIVDFITAPLRIAWTVISSILAAIVALFQGDFAKVGQILSQAGAQILSIMTSAMAGLGSAVMAGVQRVVQFFMQLGQRALAELRSLAGRMVSAGVAIIQGIVRGLQSAAGQVISFLTGLASRALAAVKNFFGIKSPSKVMAGVGQNIGQGLANGITSMTGAVLRAATAVSEEARGALSTNITTGLNLNATRAGLAGTPLGVTAAPRAASPALSSGTQGGDGAAANNTFNVTIPAKDIAEMQSVADFFDKVQQKARAGKATR